LIAVFYSKAAILDIALWYNVLMVKCLISSLEFRRGSCAGKSDFVNRSGYENSEGPERLESPTPLNATLKLPVMANPQYHCA
jgi:hypothetical protein